MKPQDLNRIAYDATEVRDTMYPRVEAAGRPLHQSKEASLEDGTRVCLRCQYPLDGGSVLCMGHWLPVDHEEIAKSWDAFRQVICDKGSKPSRAAQAGI